MLYIKPATYEDAEQEWQFVAAMPKIETGVDEPVARSHASGIYNLRSPSWKSIERLVTR